jgi:NADP-dependent 3-hydroxy acid dehydrogenase YdfG
LLLALKTPVAFYGAQQVLPAMVEEGRGTILLTGASAALRGRASFSAIAETSWQLHSQDRTACTLQLDLRPSVESF